LKNKCDQACHQTAALEVAGREAAPAPPVLQLVEDVLTIGAIAMKLADGKNLAVERGHQNGVFPDLAAVIDLGKAEPQLACLIAFSQCEGALKAPPQDDDAAMPAPSLKAQLAVLALPPGTRNHAIAADRIGRERELFGPSHGAGDGAKQPFAHASRGSMPPKFLNGLPD
jgi:hypothetical protein